MGWFAQILNLDAKPMIGKNRQLVIDEPVEFEKQPVEIRNCKKITDHFRGLYRRIYLIY